MFAAALVGLTIGIYSIVESASERCPSGMVYIPAGRFITGITEESLDYLYELCNDTAGGCYKSWFAREKPRRVIQNRSFCIDRFEYPNKYKEPPESGVTWQNAMNTCRAQGKRLCAEQEWERACKSTWDYHWSFGDTYDDNACNIATGAGELSGANLKCRSFEKVYDMNGNVAEWVLNTPPGKENRDAKIVKGGSFDDQPVFTRCTFKDYRDAREEVPQIGFRCCSFPLILK